MHLTSAEDVINCPSATSSMDFTSIKLSTCVLLGLCVSRNLMQSWLISTGSRLFIVLRYREPNTRRLSRHPAARRRLVLDILTTSGFTCKKMSNTTSCPFSECQRAIHSLVLIKPSTELPLRPLDFVVRNRLSFNLMPVFWRRYLTVLLCVITQL